MTVAILSDSPALTSGFGRTTARIAGAIASRGADVACFGLRGRAEDTPPGLPYRIWPAEQGGGWTASLSGFFAAVCPNVLLLNMDIYNAAEYVRACRDAGGLARPYPTCASTGSPPAALTLTSSDSAPPCGLPPAPARHTCAAKASAWSA